MKPNTLATEISNAVDSAQARRAELTAKRDDLAAQIEQLYAAPITKADALQFCLDYIDVRAAEWPGGLGKLASTLNDVAFPVRNQGLGKKTPITLRDVDAGLSTDWQLQQNHFLDGLHFFFSSDASRRVDTVFYFFFGEQIKAKLRENFDAFYPDVSKGLSRDSAAWLTGPNVPERRATIEKLTAELASVNQQLADVEAELATIRKALTGSVKSLAPTVPTETAHQRAMREWERDYDIWNHLHPNDAYARRFGSGWRQLSARDLQEKHRVSREHIDRIHISSRPPVKPVSAQ